VAGLAAFLMGTIMLCGFGIFADIRWERAWAWVPALAAAGIGFGAAGVAIGALTNDVRAASLLSFMVGLPLAVAALVPSGSVSPLLYDFFQAISAVFPFKPALGVIEGTLSVGQDVLIPLLHLAIVTVAYLTLGSWALRRSRSMV
jgi:ABC-2 type transport system permease protein